MNDRLYMAVHVRDENAEYTECDDHFDCDCFAPMPDPDGWAEFCEEKWGEYKPFFFPKTGVPYLSRSTAQRRVDIINYWGGSAEVLECTPNWEPIAQANKRRERSRISARISKLEDCLASERAKLASGSATL